MAQLGTGLPARVGNEELWEAKVIPRPRGRPVGDLEVGEQWASAQLPSWGLASHSWSSVGETLGP